MIFFSTSLYPFLILFIVQYVVFRTRLLRILTESNSTSKLTLYWFPVASFPMQGILSISTMDLELKYCYFYHSWDFVPYHFPFSNKLALAFLRCPRSQTSTSYGVLISKCFCSFSDCFSKYKQGERSTKQLSSLLKRSISIILVRPFWVVSLSRVKCTVYRETRCAIAQ